MYRLLIVDDEYEIRNGLCRYFPWNAAGFEVAGQVENGQEALDFLRSCPVDLVLCDIIMPVMSGIEFAEIVRKEFPSVKICFLTAHKDFEFARKAVSLNVLQYILKSSTSTELLTVFHDIKEQLDNFSAPDSSPDKALPPGSAPGQPGSQELLSRDRKLLNEICSYVEEHFATADLNSVAEKIYMSPNYVSRLFKELTDQNFSDYLLDVKMKNAEKMLNDPHNRIYEISEALGYKYVKNFSRAFHDYYGISPRDYRKGKQPTRKPESKKTDK